MFVNNHGQLQAGDYCLIYHDGNKTVTGKLHKSDEKTAIRDIIDAAGNIKPVMCATVKYAHAGIEGTSVTIPMRKPTFEDFRYYVDLMNAEPRFGNGHYSIAARYLVGLYMSMKIDTHTLYDELVAERYKQNPNLMYGTCSNCTKYGYILPDGRCNGCHPSSKMVQP